MISNQDTLIVVLDTLRTNVIELIQKSSTSDPPIISIELISLFIALIAVIIGPFIQLKIVRAQLISTERQNWIRKFQDLVSNLLSQSNIFFDSYIKGAISNSDTPNILLDMTKTTNQILLMIPSQLGKAEEFKIQFTRLLDCCKKNQGNDVYKDILETIFTLTKDLIEYQQNKINILQ